MNTESDFTVDVDEEPAFYVTISKSCFRSMDWFDVYQHEISHTIIKGDENSIRLKLGADGFDSLMHDLLKI